MYILKYDRVIDAPADIVWDVISDLEAYADYAPNLSRAERTSDGLTPTRRCYDPRGRSWNEACVLWKEGEVYSFVVETAAEDYPFPFHYLQGTWGMEHTSEGIRVYMQFRYQPKGPSILNRIINPLAKRKVTPIMRKLMDNWEAEIRARTTRKSAA